MPLPAKPLLSQIFAEFGQDATPLLSDYHRGAGGRVPPGNPPNAAIATTADAVRLSQFAGAANEVMLPIGNGSENVNLRSLYEAHFGAPTEAVRVRFTIAANVLIGGTLTAGNAAAVTVEQFPAGSIIIIDNAGIIAGKAGAPNGGAGGDAIKADYANQTVIIENRTGASILAGGGAGGVGGTGGTYYYTCVGGTSTLPWGQRYSVGCNTHGYTCHSVCQQRIGGSWYCYDQCSSGACCVQYGQMCCSGGGSDEGCQQACCDVTGTDASCSTCAYNTTCSAGGGAGGSGGRGAGYLDGGQYGGSNAGQGGSNPSNGGGVGGTGGAGGGYGAAGATGQTGGNSSSGHGGSGGGAGGTAGRAIIKGNHDVTVTNTGTITGAMV